LTGTSAAEEDRQWRAAVLLAQRDVMAGSASAIYRAGRFEPAIQGEKPIDLVAYLLEEDGENPGEGSAR
jgi:hypothetical protein